MGGIAPATGAPRGVAQRQKAERRSENPDVLTWLLLRVRSNLSTMTAVRERELPVRRGWNPTGDGDVKSSSNGVLFVLRTGPVYVGKADDRESLRKIGSGDSFLPQPIYSATRLVSSRND